ncbi:hypothetical protein ACHAXH_002186 [Discostella pseudostelligera]|jgi:1,4-dihydroxy-2-naphthoate octaprenyltransferase
MAKSSSAAAAAAEAEAIPSKFQVWKLAARPHTLTASIVPVIVGYALTQQLIRDEYYNVDAAGTTSSSSSAASSTSCLTSAYLDDEMGVGSCQLNQHQNHHLLILPLSIQFAIFAMLIQISTNLHNDYADFVKGADTNERVGQARATQRGWLTPMETCRGCAVCMVGALLVGMVYLIPMSDAYARCGIRDDASVEDGSRWWSYDPIMIFIVLSSLFNSVAYTGGPFPLGYIGLGTLSIGYSGLGDLFVFLYFGIVATVGVPYLYLTKISCRFLPFHTNNNGQAWRSLLQLLHPALLHSIPVGCLATAIIVVNNLRDRHTDVHAGKRTMAVRFGGTFAKIEYFVLVVGSYGFCMYRFMERDTDSSTEAWTTILPLLSFPMAIPQLKAVAFGGKDGQDLNVHVGGTAKLQVMYCLLTALGLTASSYR